jgi:coenzyme Q-binding protein COQ10
MLERIERHHPHYTPSQLFDLVADVERYPEFAPWITAAYVYRRTADKVWTELVAGTGPVQKRFTTVATLDRPHRISVSSHDPIFERFEQRWAFLPSHGSGTDIDYQVDLRLQSALLRAMLGRSSASRAEEMVSAFIRRAHTLYGDPRAVASSPPMAGIHGLRRPSRAL